MKKCKHEWRHMVKSGKCSSKECKENHDWLIHRCNLCGKISKGERLSE